MRPTAHGLETHLGLMHRALDEHDPRAVAIDPLTNLSDAGSGLEANRMLLRLVDHLKSKLVTAVFTSLTHGGSALEGTGTQVSSIMDTWWMLKDIESAGERNRVLYLLKSRGMAHSNQVREFRLSGRGVELADVYVGPGGVLTGSARVAQESREAQEEAAQRDEAAVRTAALARKRAALEAQIATLRAELHAEGAQAEKLRKDEKRRRTAGVDARDAQVRNRGVERND
jgi:circadian clock protein KaiC